MNRIYSIKKTALSLLVVGLAVGFSAFKDASKPKSDPQPYVFYNTGAPGNTVTTTYRYDELGSCSNPTEGNCSAVFIEDSEPADNALPTGTQSGGIQPGTYVPGP